MKIILKIENLKKLYTNVKLKKKFLIGDSSFQKSQQQLTNKATS